MTNELEQFVYGLDVAEVGVDEANRRWECYSSSGNWISCEAAGPYLPWIQYRRRPGLPMPKVPQAIEWPADAPEWAAYLTTDKDGQQKYFQEKPQLNELGYWTVEQGPCRFANHCNPFCVARSQPPKRKVNWSNQSPWVNGYWQGPVLDNNDDNPTWHFPSRWIPWNVPGCGEGCPVPDGLMVAVILANGDEIPPTESRKINFKENDGPLKVTAFQIVGKADGWK